MTVARWAPFPSNAARYKGQRGGERFAFAGLHLDDRTEMDRRPAQQLHVEVAHVESPPPGFADQRERLDEQSLERLAAAGPIAEREAHLLQLVVALGHEPLFERLDAWHQGGPLGQPPADGSARQVTQTSDLVAKGRHG